MALDGCGAGFGGVDAESNNIGYDGPVIIENAGEFPGSRCQTLDGIWVVVWVRINGGKCSIAFESVDLC